MTKRKNMKKEGRDGGNGRGTWGTAKVNSCQCLGGVSWQGFCIFRLNFFFCYATCVLIHGEKIKIF